MQSNQLFQEIWTRTENVVCREVADENLLIPVCGELAQLQKIFVLDNDVSKIVWDELKTPQNLSQMTDTLVKILDVNKDELLDDLHNFFTMLEKESLIEKVYPDEQ